MFTTVRYYFQGIYIRGNTPIILEPTITNVRENGTEDSRLTLGALASARVCCIDQLDKVSPIQQQVTKARPGIYLNDNYNRSNNVCLADNI